MLRSTFVQRALGVLAAEYLRLVWLTNRFVYDPATRVVSTEPLEEFLDLLPTRLIQFRIYALTHEADAQLAQAAATVMNKTPSSIQTNV